MRWWPQNSMPRTVMNVWPPRDTSQNPGRRCPCRTTTCRSCGGAARRASRTRARTAATPASTCSHAAGWIVASRSARSSRPSRPSASAGRPAGSSVDRTSRSIDRRRRSATDRVHGSETHVAMPRRRADSVSGTVGRSSAASADSTPLTNRPLSSVEKRLASSTASSMHHRDRDVGTPEQLERGEAQHAEVDHRHARQCPALGRARRSPRRARARWASTPAHQQRVSSSGSSTWRSSTSAGGDALRLRPRTAGTAPAPGRRSVVVGACPTSCHVRLG